MFACMKKDHWIDNNGIYIETESNADFSSVYTTEQHERWVKIEDYSWWYRYRGEVTEWVAGHFFVKCQETLDIGGGNGYSTRILQKAGYHVAMIEPSEEGCRNAKSRGIDNIYCGFFDDESVYDDSVSQIMLLDVLEHIEDDKTFLENIYTKLKRDGVCMIAVPAFMTLWSSEDVKAGHSRRYTLKDLCTLAEDVGFNVIYDNYFMQYLYFPVLVVRVWLEKLGIISKATVRTKAQEQRIELQQFRERKGLIGKILDAFHKREMNMLQNGKIIPFGTSAIVVVKKK